MPPKRPADGEAGGGEAKRPAGKAGGGELVSTLTHRETLNIGNEFLRLPPEIQLMILEKLAKIDPVTLLGSVPGVSRQLRALTPLVRGTLQSDVFPLMYDEEAKIRAQTGALQFVVRSFPRLTGLDMIMKYPLHYLIATADETLLNDRLEPLLKPETINQRKNEWGKTMLYLACERGLLKVAEMLIEGGADVEKGDVLRVTPLFVACENGHLDVAKLLLDNGADVDKAMDGGLTPLFIACHKGHLDVAKLLIDKGADINKEDCYGSTPLVAARRNGYTDIVKFIEDRGVAQ